MPLRTVVLAHRLDIAWMIALWKAIHGGDPGPDEVIAVDERTVELAAALVQHLAESEVLAGVERAAPEVLRQRLRGLGVGVSGATEEPMMLIEGEPEQPETPPRLRRYCFDFGEETICIELRHRPYKVAE